jgi:hypothetical protein
MKKLYIGWEKKEQVGNLNYPSLHINKKNDYWGVEVPLSGVNSMRLAIFMV